MFTCPLSQKKLTISQHPLFFVEDASFPQASNIVFLKEIS
jgi:hypothetical protein